MSSSRLIDITDPEIQKTWPKVLGASYESFKRGTFQLPSNAYEKVAMAGFPQPLALGNSKQTNLELEKKWHPIWAYLPLLSFSSKVHQYIIKKDFLNIVHPSIRIIAKPVSFLAITGHALNTFAMTKLAGYDNSLCAYETAASLTWQSFNNFILPAIIFKLGAALAPRNVTVAYSSALIAVLTSLAVGSQTKYKIEELFLNRRWRRKEYGNGGQDFYSKSLYHDNVIDYIENPGNVGGQEVPGSYLENFPGFMTAEVAPAWEVPYNSVDFATLQTYYVHGAYLEKQLDTKQGEKLPIPAPSPATYRRFCKRYGEYSIASRTQHRLDESLGLDFETISNKDDKDVLAHIREQRRRHQVIERIFKQQIAIANQQ